MANLGLYVPVSNNLKDEGCHDGLIHGPRHDYDAYSLDSSTINLVSYPPRLILPSARKAKFEGLELLKSICLPAIALGYFAFCYIVHTKNVSVMSTRLVDLSRYDLKTIKSITSSLSITVMTVGLLPIKSLIQDLKNEEFFRVLSFKPRGVPLSIVNTISTPAAGDIETFRAIVSKRSSRYLVVAFIAGILVLLARTLAPAALSVAMILTDGETVALRVGAIRANSVVNFTDGDGLEEDRSIVQNYAALAGSIAWAEWSLGARYQFSSPDYDASDGEAYIVPFPLDLPFDAYARWVTDVVVLKSECTWAKTNVSSEGLKVERKLSGAEEVYNLELEGHSGLSFVFFPDNLWENSLVEAPVLTFPHPEQIQNSTTQDIALTGATVFQLAQPVPFAEPGSWSHWVRIDMSNLPSFQVIAADVTVEVSLLMCHPRTSIKTGIVRSEMGKLSVDSSFIPSPISYYSSTSRPRSQGNIDKPQLDYLLPLLMSKFKDAGPTISETRSRSPFLETSDLISSIIFGAEAVRSADSAPPGWTGFGQVQELTPLPEEDITTGYISLLQSTSKSFTNGALGHEVVPARIATPTLVFTSSLPLTITAFVVFTLLCVILVFAQFRKGKGENFTFYQVTAALNGSALPQEFAHAIEDGVNIEDSNGILGTGIVLGKKKDDDPLQLEAEKLRSRRLVLKRNPAGGAQLHLV